MYFRPLANRKFFLTLLGIFVLAFLLVPRPADAIAWIPLVLIGVLAYELFPDILGRIAGTAGQYVFDALVIFFNTIFATIAGVLQGIYIGMGEILISITQYFISIPVSPSNSLTPPFVIQAFDFSRLLVNGFFLLTLAFIGLATILRLQEYQLQRTLPKLILIALLVNFSGVFVGLVVDIANLLTHYFLNAVAGTDALYSSNPWGAFQPDPARLGQNIARIVFYLVGVLIYFVIMFVFGFRVLVLWVLTILAPIAFAAFILPATRKWWNQWLSALIQWAFIGLPISFFLVLAGNAISMELPQTTSTIGVEIYNVFAPASALLLLFVGIGISLSLAPAWGRRLALLGAAGGVAAGVGLGYLGLRRYGKSTQQFFENMGQRGQGIPIRDENKTPLERGLERVGRLPGFKQVGNIGRGLWATGEALERQEAKGGVRGKLAGWALRGGLAGAGAIQKRTRGIVAGAARMAEAGTSRLVTLANKSAEEALAKAMREAQRLRPQDNAVRIREALTRPTRESSMTALAHYLKMVIDDDPSDIEGLVKTGALSQNHLKKIGVAAKQLKNPNHYRTFLKSQISRINDFEPGWGEQDINRFIHRFVRMEDISNINIDWHQYDPTDDEKKKTLDRLLLQMGRNPLPAMLQAVSDPAARERIMDHLESHDDNWFIDNRKDNILLWSTSNAALDQFGLSPIRNYTRAQAQRIVRERRLKNRSTESLQQELDNLTQELEVLKVSGSLTQRRPMERQIDRVKAEQKMRLQKDEELEQQATAHANAIDQLNTTPEDQRNPDWYSKKAHAQIELRDVQEEQNRRRREAPSPAEAIKGIRIPPITESVGEQIANRESQARKIDELLARPDIPERQEKEKELKKANKELEQLRARRDQLPPELRSKEQTLETLQRNYLNVSKKAQELRLEIGEERTLGATDAAIQIQADRLKKAEDTLKELEKDRAIARQDRNQFIAQRRSVQQPPAETFAEEVAAMRAHEWELTRRLRQQEATAAPIDVIRKTESLLNQTKLEKEASERKLVAVLRAQEIPEELTTLNETYQNIDSQIRDFERRIPTASGEAQQIMQNRLVGRRQELQKVAQKRDQTSEEENRIKRMEGDWTDANTIMRRRELVNESAEIQKQLLANPTVDERQALEAQLNTKDAELQSLFGIAERDPNKLTASERRKRDTYLRDMERIKQRKSVNQKMERLIKQYEATERQIHREARREEQGI